MKHNAPLVSPAWLASQLDAREAGQRPPVILEATMKQSVLPEKLPDRLDYLPGAIKFDIENTFTDHDNTQPHSLPNATQFTRQAQQLGIDNNSVIVIYDARGVYSSPRAWWMFKCMGHDEVYVLDGGLSAWKTSGFDTQPALSAPDKMGSFVAHAAHAAKGQQHCHGYSRYGAGDVLTAIEDKQTQIIDVRSAGRFAGVAPEPRAGLRSGHIPSSVNLPFTLLIEQGHFCQLDVLTSLFEDIKAQEYQRLVFSCGSGITACIGALAAEVVGLTGAGIYDGSWSEWGADPQFPIEKDE